MNDKLVFSFTGCLDLRVGQCEFLGFFPMHLLFIISVH